MISQIELTSEIMKIVAKHGNPTVSVRHMNCIIHAATMITNEFAKPDIMSETGMGLSAWRKSHDTGLSSRFMASVIWGGSDEYAHPYDPDDFGRCYRLIRAVPGTREKLSMLSDKSEYWRLLVEDWDNLEKLYEYQLNDKTEKKKEKKYPCWDRMQELQEKAKSAQRHIA